jgi:hypothetical protein
MSGYCGRLDPKLIKVLSNPSNCQRSISVARRVRLLPVHRLTKRTGKGLGTGAWQFWISWSLALRHSLVRESPVGLATLLSQICLLPLAGLVIVLSLK